jgi:hypothetical protein
LSPRGTCQVIIEWCFRVTNYSDWVFFPVFLGVMWRMSRITLKYVRTICIRFITYSPFIIIFISVQLCLRFSVLRAKLNNVRINIFNSVTMVTELKWQKVKLSFQSCNFVVLGTDDFLVTVAINSLSQGTSGCDWRRDQTTDIAYAERKTGHSATYAALVFGLHS